MDDEQLGRENYAGYCAAVEHKTWDGKPCPRWEDLTDRIRAGWCAGAARVERLLVTGTEPLPRQR